MSAFKANTAKNPHEIEVDGITFLVREPTVEEGLAILSKAEGGDFDGTTAAYAQAVRIGLVGWEGEGAPKFLPNNPNQNAQLLDDDSYFEIAQWVVDHAKATAATLVNLASPSTSDDPTSSVAGEDPNVPSAETDTPLGSSPTARSRKRARTS